MPTKNSDKTDTPPVANEHPASRQQADAVRQKLAEQGINAEDISAAVAWARANREDKS